MTSSMYKDIWVTDVTVSYIPNTYYKINPQNAILNRKIIIDDNLSILPNILYRITITFL